MHENLLFHPGQTDHAEAPWQSCEEDILRTYDLGVNSFISKPVTFEGLVDVLRVLGNYWLEIVELPPDVPGR